MQFQCNLAKSSNALNGQCNHCAMNNFGIN
jgi:hypothetical protein